MSSACARRRTFILHQIHATELFSKNNNIIFARTNTNGKRACGARLLTSCGARHATVYNINAHYYSPPCPRAIAIFRFYNHLITAPQNLVVANVAYYGLFVAAKASRWKLFVVLDLLFLLFPVFLFARVQHTISYSYIIQLSAYAITILRHRKPDRRFIVIHRKSTSLRTFGIDWFPSSSSSSSSLRLFSTIDILNLAVHVHNHFVIART